MATVVLAAAGAAMGGAFGGAVMGIGAAALGQTAGAIAGGLIDQKVLGSGSEAVERGRNGSLRIQTANEGAPIPRVYGRMRVAGQMIWSTKFRESVVESGGGKGGGPRVRDYSYSLSFAVALAEGPISRIGRVWADGKPMILDSVQWRLHRGGERQGPDPLIEAVEGEAPAFRGVAYLVFEDLPVEPYGNRAPQITVEVFRQPRTPAKVEIADEDYELHRIIRGVAMSPGTGEFAYDTDPVRIVEDEGRERFANVNSWSERTDAVVALDQLEGDLPECRSVSLVASWFGDDLRCNRCELRPGVEFDASNTQPHVWSVSGVGREQARLVSRDAEGRPIYGGTPSDGSLVRYIREVKARGMRVVFYPFILMDVPDGNALPDPWTGGVGQPALPWRGRITTSRAPGVGDVDQTVQAAEEVSAFFGAAQAQDFTASGDAVVYSGPEDWGMRRFILHYAHLCALAGGVDGFCIGSEMRSLTQIRSGRTSYPAVDAFRELARDVRAVLGSATKIGYAADWSEYFGHQPQDGTGDRLYHLDPLWADPSIDFIGIDWYAPLTDWRDGRDHLDAAEASSIYDLDYLSSRFSAGEGYDWHYASDADRAAQARTPIADGAHGEPWIWRYKDLRNWWSKGHYQRIDGVRSGSRTPWRPRSKPIWLTEIGCGAVDKGPNQPNLFVDPKSSENGLPHYSSGARDDLVQRRMLQAAVRHWSSDKANPLSNVYGGRMLDLDNTYVWTWDARPWPEFPRRLDVWSDGGNHGFGHWLSGRVASASLDRIVAEICNDAGLRNVDVSDLTALVDGFVQERTQSPREALQSLMLAYGFDAMESGGVLRFAMRGRAKAIELSPQVVVAEAAGEGRDLERSRSAEGGAVSLVRVGYLQGDGDYQAGAAEVRNPEAEALGVQGADLPIAMTRSQAVWIGERWARESEMSRETARFAVPPSLMALEPGDVIRFESDERTEYRVERISDGVGRSVEATRIESSIYRSGARSLPVEPPSPLAERTAPGRPGYRLLDVPWSIFGGSEASPYAAVWADPWPGAVSVYASDRDDGYRPAGVARRAATVARLLDPLAAAEPWRWSRGAPIAVEMLSGALRSLDELGVYNGGNLSALASPHGGWELVQFQSAELISPNRYLLSNFLRGLGGTEKLMGDPTPTGAVLVLLDSSLVALEGGEAWRGLERHFRIGPAGTDLGDASFAHAVWTHQGVGLRPHAPAAVEAHRQPDGAIRVEWIRRGRRDPDTWPAGETPLFETSERYRVKVRSLSGSVAREVETSAPHYLYSSMAQGGDGVSGGAIFEIAQVSAGYGAGFETKVTFNG